MEDLVAPSGYRVRETEPKRLAVKTNDKNDDCIDETIFSKLLKLVNIVPDKRDSIVNSIVSKTRKKDKKDTRKTRRLAKLETNNCSKAVKETRMLAKSRKIKPL